MKKLAQIGSYSRKIYRLYTNDLLNLLQVKGYIDLRPSFLEILMYICENTGASIKEIGLACGLKKQTMTSHLNELEARGYIYRKNSLKDRREFEVFLTDFGEQFKFTLIEVNHDLEETYLQKISEIDMNRLESLLNSFHKNMKSEKESDQLNLI